MRAGLVVVATALAIAAAATTTDILPHAIRQAIARNDPAALAADSIPRLAALDAAQRAALASVLVDRDVGARVASYAFLQVGTPYRLGPLGEESPPDDDPLIAFDSTDCTTINLVSTALAHASDAGGERAAMAIANYRGGAVSFATRFHFTTDRLDSCPYFGDITRRVAGAACRRQRVTLNRRAHGGRLIDIDWSRTRDVDYVPRALGALFKRWYVSGRLPAAMGIAFVQRTRMDDGLDVVHESLLWQGHTLLHASSKSGRVVMMPWPEFLNGPGRRYDGFVLFEYR